MISVHAPAKSRIGAILLLNLMFTLPACHDHQVPVNPSDPNLCETSPSGCDYDGDGYTAPGGDCDDHNPVINPVSSEHCDGIDNNCDGRVDDSSALEVQLWYLDADQDGYGDQARLQRACAQPAGYVAPHSDCDDGDPAVNPGAIEVCDNVDNNCDGRTDGPDAVDALTWYPDADGDSYGDPAGVVRACTAPDGGVADGTDCNDTSAAISPAALEACNGIDDDCDGQIDDGVTSTFYHDLDGDFFGDPNAPVQACNLPTGYVANADDCDDADPVAYPGSPERCNHTDDDCDGQIDEGTGFQSIAAGRYHSLALACAGGVVWAWGKNDDGQVGDGTGTGRFTPVRVGALREATLIATGERHSLAALSDGTVWAWGLNDYGQLGDGSRSNRVEPVQVSGLNSVIALAGGNAHSLALTSDGKVWAWGHDYYGQLGNGANQDQLTRVQVKGLSSVIAIAAGAFHSVALRWDGTVWVWGANYDGQLGDDSGKAQNVPVQLEGLSNIIAISSNWDYTLALTEDNTVWAWGDNSSGQLGAGTTTRLWGPQEVTGAAGAIAIAAGEWHALALLSGPDLSVVIAWGLNLAGQLGNGATATMSGPVQTWALTEVTAISGGGYHSLALDSSVGNLFAWGDNTDGQLGLGSGISTAVSPKQVIFEE